MTRNMTQECSNDILFLDSTCSNHITRNKDLFFNLDTNTQSFEVKLVNDIKVCLKCKGRIIVYTRDGDRRTTDDVYYVPIMKCNLLRIGQLIEKMYRVLFKNNVCTIIDKYSSKQLIGRVEMTKNRMFPLIMRN